MLLVKCQTMKGINVADSLTMKYHQISESLLEATTQLTRFEERVDLFTQKILAVEAKLENHIENCPVKCKFGDAVNRIAILESKDSKELKGEVNDIKKEINGLRLEVHDIKKDTKTHEGKWKSVTTFVLSVVAPIIYIIVGAFFAKWLGLQPSL